MDLSWMNKGNCFGVDPNIMIPVEKSDEHIAKEICQGCPIKEPCLDYALSHQEDGIWGGTDRRERYKIRKARRLQAGA